MGVKPRTHVLNYSLYMTSQNNMMMPIKEELKCWLLTNLFLSKYREKQNRIITRRGPVAEGGRAHDPVSVSPNFRAILHTPSQEQASSTCSLPNTDRGSSGLTQVEGI